MNQPFLYHDHYHHQAELDFRRLTSLLLTSLNETNSSDPSSSGSRGSYLAGAVVGGVLGLIILLGLGSIAYFRRVVLPRSQKERETRNSGTWDDSFRPSLVISSWVGRVVSTRYSISRQPFTSDMEGSGASNDPYEGNQPSSSSLSSINQDSDSVFQSPNQLPLRSSPGRDSSRLSQSVQESVRESIRESMRESGGQSTRDRAISRESPGPLGGASSGLSVLRTSPLGRSPVVLARSMDSSRRRTHSGPIASTSSSSSPVEVSVLIYFLWIFDDSFMCLVDLSICVCILGPRHTRHPVAGNSASGGYRSSRTSAAHSRFATGKLNNTFSYMQFSILNHVIYDIF